MLNKAKNKKIGIDVCHACILNLLIQVLFKAYNCSFCVKYFVCMQNINRLNSTKLDHNKSKAVNVFFWISAFCNF